MGAKRLRTVEVRRRRKECEKRYRPGYLARKKQIFKGVFVKAAL